MPAFDESLLEPAFDESLLVPETRPERGQRLRSELIAVRQEPAALSDPNASAPAPVTTFQSANETMLMPPGEEYRQFQLPRAGAPGISPVTTFQGPSETTLLPNEDARRVGEVLQNTAASGIEGIVNPMTPPFILGTMAAPEIAIPLLTATMGKSGSIKLAEGIVDLEQGREKEGVAKLGAAGSELGLAALPALHPSAFSGRPQVELPLSLRAAREEPSPVQAAPGVERLNTGQPIASPIAVELMTPDQFDAYKSAREKAELENKQADARRRLAAGQLVDPNKISVALENERGALRNALDSGRPVNAALLDRYNANSERPLKLPDGYVKEGDVYLRKQQGIPPAPAEAKSAPPTSAEEAAIQEQLRTEQPGIATVEPPAPAVAPASEPAPAPAEAPKPAAPPALSGAKLHKAYRDRFDTLDEQARADAFGEMGFDADPDTGRLYMTDRDNKRLYLNGDQLADAKREFLRLTEPKPAPLTPAEQAAAPAVSLRQQHINWGLENLPFEQTATVPEGSASYEPLEALRSAGVPLRDALDMLGGKKPFPSRAAFEKGVNDTYTGDALELRQKVLRELADLGLDVREVNVPKRSEYGTGREFYEAIEDLERRMRSEGVSMGAALVRTGQLPKPFTKASTPKRAEPTTPAELPAARAEEAPAAPTPEAPAAAPAPELMSPREYLAQAGEVEPMAALRQHYAEMQRAYRELKPINAEAADKYEPDIAGSTQKLGEWLLDHGYKREGERYVHDPEANLTGPQMREIAERMLRERKAPEAPKPAPVPVAEPATTPAAAAPAAPVEAAPVPEPAELSIPLINLRESEATPMALGKIKARDPERWQDIVKYFKVGDTPGAIAKIAQEKIAEIKAREVPEPPKADVGKPEEPPPPQTTQYGMMMPGVEMLLGEMPGKTVAPTSEPFWNTERSFSQNISGVAGWIRDLWRGFAMKQAPKITDSNRAAGESGVRYAASHLVARAKGLEFGATVLRDTGVDPKKFGVALSEDNLRSIKDSWTQEAASATAAGNADAAALAQDKADAVRTLIGAERSPFKTEAEYQAFLNDPAVKTAIARHIQLWQEQKDPLFRQANDLDPDVPLAGRGKQTGARINLKALAPDEPGYNRAVGGRPSKLRQLSTKLRRDPFARRATGGGQAYEPDYNELMAHGFGTEYPIAAQHQFIKALIEAGDAKVTDKEFPEGMTIKGEKPVANILRLNPWRGKFLQVRRSLVDEYRAISNLDEPWKIPILTPFNDLMTKQSIQGFAEGSTHTSNLMMEIFTGLGPTNNPLLNGLIKSVGRADLLYSVPRVIIKAFQDTKPEMLRLAEAGMAKEPYQGKMLGRILNGADRGVRLVSEQIYDGMAKKGWVENTETGKREFINQIGNYNKRLQPSLIRKLRDTGIQPFATAMQTFNVMGLRRLVGAPGAKATSNMAALALRADIAGGFIGFVALTGYLNYLLSGNATGPKGTPIGAVGWKDEHGKTHFFNVGRLLGYERGARITGLGPYMEARRNGLTHEQALQAGGRSVASTVMSYPAGPGPRALYTVGTGMRMNQPTVREAPAVPPTESLNPLKTQLAKNIQTAVIEANPAISSLHDLREGKSASDIAEKQFGRYTPREGKSEGFYRALPKIVTKGQLIDYADDVVKEARKLPISQRMSYIQTRFNKDDLKAQYRNDVMTEIKRKGVLRYQ